MGVWPITRKDLLVLGRDRRTVAVLLLLPLVFIAILGLSTGRLLGWRNENETLHVALVDEGGGPLAAAVAEGLESRGGIELEWMADRSAAQRRVDDGDRVAAIVFGAEFEQRVQALSLADVLDPQNDRLATGLDTLDISVYTRPAQVVAGKLVEQLVLAQLLRAALPQIAHREPRLREYLSARSASEPTEAGAVQAGTVRRVEPGLKSSVYQVLVPSYTVMFAFFLINIMGRSFISERDLGTLRRLRAAPITHHAVLAGKTIPFFIISVVQGGLLFLFGRLLFGMSWGSTPWMLLPVIACTSLAATALGLLTATLVRTDAQVSAYANLLVITLAGISGCFMPREWLPEFMRRVSLATPHAWALIAYDQLLTHARPDQTRVWASCGVLAAFAATFFVLGWWRFARTEAT